MQVVRGSPAEGRPTLLRRRVVDWADKLSLLLLGFLARQVRDAKLLIVGSYRDVVIGREFELEALARVSGTQAVRLLALLEEAVAARSRSNEIELPTPDRDVVRGGPRGHPEGSPTTGREGSSMAYNVGLDVHRKACSFVIQAADGTVVRQGGIPTTAAGFQQLIGEHAVPPGTPVALETGTVAFFIARALTALGLVPSVIDAHEVRLKAYRPQQKSDRRDAYELCDGLRRAPRARAAGRAPGFRYGDTG